MVWVKEVIEKTLENFRVKKRGERYVVCLLIILVLERLRKNCEFEWGQPVLHYEFKASLSYIERPCLREERKEEPILVSFVLLGENISPLVPLDHGGAITGAQWESQTAWKRDSESGIIMSFFLFGSINMFSAEKSSQERAFWAEV